MMPSHFALSDALIVFVAGYAAVALSRERLLLPTFAMACFAIPAAVGVVRFGAGLQDELATLHAGTSQLLGLAGVFALASTIFRPFGSGRDLLLAASSLGAAGLAFAFSSALIAPLFVLALILALSAALLRAKRTGSGWLTVTGLSLLLVNALVIRRAPWLTEATAWHVYHLLIALALAIMAVDIRRREP